MAAGKPLNKATPAAEAAIGAEAGTPAAIHPAITAKLLAPQKSVDFGEIGGLPRLLDIGQCNDTYSALQIAIALAKAFDCGVNDLPLSMVLSWYEQKAVAVLLTLLHLGVRNIRIGPTLPAFLSPAVLSLLHENFNLMAITSAQDDLSAMMA
ncbi:MAG TPA: hypothetical protein VHW46_05240 [Terracidiphilus sp.]|nr:hypothetical protein [Terracidiphilus sp.]